VRRVRVPIRSLVCLVAPAALAVGCGGAGTTPQPPSGPPPLPAAAVPYLDSTVNQLTSAGLALEAQLPDLAGRLQAWGFDGVSRRYFQGQSRRRLQVVDSRSLRFGSPAGARGFVRFVRAHPGSFLGGALRPHAFSSRGRTGIVPKGALCACHLATPAYLAVVARGDRVTWLEINGPGATRTALHRLAARAP
jgi:hypothetical protein